MNHNLVTNPPINRENQKIVKRENPQSPNQIPMPYKEKPIVKRYLTIGELANKLEVATSQLRYYEEEGIIKSDVNPGHKSYARKYKANNVEKIRKVIEAAKTKSFTLRGLKHIYKTGEAPPLQTTEL